MGDQDKYPMQTRKNNTVQLHDSGLQAGSLIEQSLSKLNQEQASNLMAKAGEEALRLEVKSREQNMDYVVGKKVVEDHIDTFAMLDKNGRTTRQTVITDVKTGAGNMRIESKSGATCFVASVAFNDPNHPDVIFLRGFRDNVLSKSGIGRSFIDWYWKNGPRIANSVGKSIVLQKSARVLISGFVKLLR